MPIRDCEPLLKICGPKIYSRNAFRLLGMDVDQKVRRIKRKVHELQAAIEVEDLADEYNNCLAPNPLPTREEISQTSQALTDAQQRFIHEFFWFWPMEWGKSASDPILTLLKNNNTKEAKKRWKQIACDGGESSLAAQHNLAILGHLYAIDREQRILEATDNGELTKEQRKKLNKFWTRAFVYWTPLCRDKEFWSLQADRIRKLDDPRLTTEFLERFSQSLPIAFDNINADFAVAYCDRKMYARARDHVRIMKATQEGDDDVDASLRRVTEPLQGRIDQALETATSGLIQNKTEGRQRSVGLFQTVRKLLNVLRVLLGKDSPEFVDTCDRVAENMLQCQFVYLNETEDWEGSILIIESALKVARREKLRTEIEKILGIIKKNAKHKREKEMCWFCKTNKAEDRSKNTILMHGDIARTRTSMNGTRVTFKHASISVPRCVTCKGAHDRGVMGCWLGFVLFVIVVVVGLFVAKGIGAVLGGVLGLTAGMLISWALAPGRDGIPGINASLEYPSVVELVSKGWEVGEEPSE
ncbi:hypothetical protein N9Z53_00120 [Mariniblastus sp.]|nr:hypothetical protein [Mariniblastus sp.]